MLTLVLPIYRSEANLPALFEAVVDLSTKISLEAVFVVDGSPDRSAEILERELPKLPLQSQLVLLSRNFGSFAAITAGFACGNGDYFSVLAADLQEPPELLLKFVERLASGEVDIVVGQRAGRNDPVVSRAFSSIFWTLFRQFAVSEIPRGGIDTFGCTRQVRDHLLALPETDSSLVSLLFWVGFRRETIPFVRRERMIGKSAWTFRKKLDYALQSFFNFTDLPIRLLLVIGAGSSILALLFGVLVTIAKYSGWIDVRGYAALSVLIAFFGGTTTFGLGVVGQYIWLTLQNARRRPNYIVRSAQSYGNSPIVRTDRRSVDASIT